jgi:hypothetical protein
MAKDFSNRENRFYNAPEISRIFTINMDLVGDTST